VTLHAPLRLSHRPMYGMTFFLFDSMTISRALAHLHYTLHCHTSHTRTPCPSEAILSGQVGMYSWPT
jgi:hypothetical protein